MDQAASNPSFLQFRNRLLQAVVEKDAAFIESVLAPDIELSFGGHSGLADFREIWKPEQPDSELWEELGEVLRLGGTFEPDGSFIAPYLFSRLPDHLDPTDYLVVVGDGVALRAAPKSDAAIVARLSYDIVTPEPLEKDAGPGRHAWSKVRTANGRSGYVARRFLRSPLQDRAGFAKRDGQWRMIFFLAGD